MKRLAVLSLLLAMTLGLGALHIGDDTRVQPRGTQSSTVGAGDQLALFPLGFSEPSYSYQTLYRGVELGFMSGTISALAICNNFQRQKQDVPTQIYLGSTDRDDMSAGFIPTSELTLVFDDLVEYPTGENVILFQLQTPYVHTGGNLVMMFHRPFVEYHYVYSNLFKCQSGGRNRACYAAFDPGLDPQDPISEGLTAIYPQVTFYHLPDSIQNDLAAWDIDGNRTPTLGEPSPYTVRIRNMGVEAQANYSVKLKGPDDAELVSVAGPLIAGLQTLELVIPWTPSAEGNYAIYATVEMDGDEYASNNRTANCDIMVQPADVHAVTIGDGSEDKWYPMDMSRPYSLVQTLYYPDEMEGAAGYITGVRFYNDFTRDMRNVPISIWIDTTTESDLADGFTSSLQLKQVYDDLAYLPSGRSVVEFTFDEPFMYTGESNLVLMVYKASINYFGSVNLFRCQTQGSNRSVHASDLRIINPPFPPRGTVSAEFPQTTFLFDPYELGQVSGTVTAADGQPIGNAEISINDGLFSTTTNEAGEYRFTHVLIFPEAYTLSISAYGYYDFSQSFELGADEQLTLDVCMQAYPQVSVSGTVFAGDTLAELSGAVIKLSGYGSHEAVTDEQGFFNLSAYGFHSYAYEISAPGYSTQTGQIDLDDTDLDLGEIMLMELTYAPVKVTAALSEAGDAVDIKWFAPVREDGEGAAGAKEESARHQVFSLGGPGLSLSPANSLKSGGSKVFVGYMVYRLQVNQVHYPGAWISLTPEPITALEFSDTVWSSLPNGYYRWAVISMYSNGVTSKTSFSNHLERYVPCGTVVGTVKTKDNVAIFGANITNGQISTTTNQMGAYAFPLPVSTHTLTVSAPGYISQTVEDVTVNLNLFTTLHFVLLRERDGDGQIPVVATALHGNYPNPFNPETTISYSIKKPGRVRLEVYNIKGQKVCTLVDEDHATGHYKRIFNAKDDRGRSVSSGVYLIRMSAPGYRKTAKMMLMQ